MLPEALLGLVANLASSAIWERVTKKPAYLERLARIAVQDAGLTNVVDVKRLVTLLQQPELLQRLQNPPEAEAFLERLAQTLDPDEYSNRDQHCRALLDAAWSVPCQPRSDPRSNIWRSS